MMKIIHNLPAKLASIEIWIISACVLLSMLYPDALLGAVVIGVFFWFIRRLTGGQFTVRTPIDISVLLLLLMIPINLWATAIPSKTYPQVYRLLTGVILLYSMVNWGRTSTRIRWLVFGVVLGTFFLALFSTISVEWTQQKLLFIPASIYDRFILLVKDTVHRNVMAGNLVILFPVTLGLLLFAWKEHSGWNRFLLFMVACTVFGILILTQSRGALLALGVVLLMLITLRWKWGWITIPFSLLAASGIIAFLGADKFVEILSSGVSLGGLEGRLEVWSRAIYMIQDFPITGVGLGLFGDVADNLYPFFLNPVGSVPHAHNLFLQIAVDVGIPGLIVWLSILFIVLALSWQLYRFGRQREDHWTTGLGAGLFCSQLALIVHGFLDAVTWGAVRPVPIVWALWGLTSAAWIYNRKKQA
jgi:putative inorganic carbon (HCO3(-)) transporter